MVFGRVEKAKFSNDKKGQIKPNFLRKFTKFIKLNLKYHQMLYVLLKFSQNRPKKILFSLRLKKGQEKAKWLNHFISRKLFQKGQMATLVFGNGSAVREAFIYASQPSQK